MNIARVRVPVVLSHVIKIEGEMLVDLPADSEVGAITYPRRRNRIIEDFIGHKAREL